MERGDKNTSSVLRQTRTKLRSCEAIDVWELRIDLILDLLKTSNWNSSILSKSFFVVPHFKPHQLQAYDLWRQYLQHTRICWREQRHKDVIRLVLQHNAPTHLPSYCIFRLVELSWAQFDYMHCVEMKVSKHHEIRTWIPCNLNPAL